jgi:Siphovirus Gp157
MNQSTRLWELSDEIQQLEDAIATIQENETLSDDDRENQLQQTFSKWLEVGESFKTKAELVAAYIRHQEALAEARKAEARRIRTLAEQAENQANRLRHYLTNEMLRSRVDRIDGVTVKIGLRKKPPKVLLNVPLEELPSEYVAVEYTPKLAKIKELLKSNEAKTLDWASLSEMSEYSVTIR